MKYWTPRVALAAALGALGAVSTASGAHAQTLRTVINDTLRGGVTVDGWGVASTETALSSGVFHLRIPAGSQVRRAVLITATMAGTQVMPPGPAGNPRVVVLGTGSSSQTIPIEGMPTDSVLSATYGFYWGEWTTDVTTVVDQYAGASPGGEFTVPVAERGDHATTFPQYPYLLGHSLVVEYDNPSAPLRNVVLYAGAANAGFVTSTPLPLPSPVANNCPPTSPRSEPFAASLGIHFEWNGSEEDQPVSVNGMLITSHAGGSDDSDTPSTAAMGIFSGLTTTGSFGGADPTATTAIGAPAGLENDELLGPPTLPPGRLDDELYDFRPIIADGATSVTFAYSTTGVADDQMVGSLVIQTLARDSTDDADRDGVSDTIEGNCTVDTDADGTPDYLDLDSDNDCLPDAMDSGAARTSDTMPGAPDANCAHGAVRMTCDRSVGRCVCASDVQCGDATPVCNAGTRACEACVLDAQCASVSAETRLCVTSGAGLGRCVGCRTAADCATDRPVCDAVTMRCVAATTDAGTPDGGVDASAGMDVATVDASASDSGPRDAMDATSAADGGQVPRGGGCGCRTTGSPSQTPVRALVVAGALALLVRRRRR
ncbi:MAG: MYXO-CTERM sorting domain-containing protein [Deltaproteobacteria bacterium]